MDDKHAQLIKLSTADRQKGSNRHVKKPFLLFLLHAQLWFVRFRRLPVVLLALFPIELAGLLLELSQHCNSHVSPPNTAWPQARNTEHHQPQKPQDTTTITIATITIATITIATTNQQEQPPPPLPSPPPTNNNNNHNHCHHHLSKTCGIRPDFSVSCGCRSSACLALCTARRPSQCPSCSELSGQRHRQAPQTRTKSIVGQSQFSFSWP